MASNEFELQEFYIPLPPYGKILTPINLYVTIPLAIPINISTSQIIISSTSELPMDTNMSSLSPLPDSNILYLLKESTNIANNASDIPVDEINSYTKRITDIMSTAFRETVLPIPPYPILYKIAGYDSQSIYPYQQIYYPPALLPYIICLLYELESTNINPKDFIELIISTKSRLLDKILSFQFSYFPTLAQIIDYTLSIIYPIYWANPDAGEQDVLAFIATAYIHLAIAKSVLAILQTPPYSEAAKLIPDLIIPKGDDYIDVISLINGNLVSLSSKNKFCDLLYKEVIYTFLHNIIGYIFNFNPESVFNIILYPNLEENTSTLETIINIISSLEEELFSSSIVTRMGLFAISSIGLQHINQLTSVVYPKFSELPDVIPITNTSLTIKSNQATLSVYVNSLSIEKVLQNLFPF